MKVISINGTTYLTHEATEEHADGAMELKEERVTLSEARDYAKLSNIGELRAMHYSNIIFTIRDLTPLEYSNFEVVKAAMEQAHKFAVPLLINQKFDNIMGKL